MCRTSGMPKVGSRRTTTPAASPLLMRLASAWLIMKAGTSGLPPPKPPSKGSPGATRPMMPARPPPAAMLLILMLNAQTPRSTSTTLPASEPAGKGSQPSKLPPAPLPYCSGASITEVNGADQGWKTA